MSKRKVFMRTDPYSNVRRTISLMQYDTTELTIDARTDNEPFELMGICVVLIGSRNDKTIATQSETVSVSGNILTMKLAPAFVSAEGRIKLQLIFKSVETDEMISSYMFEANVAKNLLSESPSENGGGNPGVIIGGTSNYNSLYNKPSINGKVLEGEVSLAELGISEDGSIQGKNGVSPEITVVDDSDTEYRLKIVDVNGEILTPNLKGKPGKNGDDGYTPQKGVDYFTDDDKAEFVRSVLTALPVNTSLLARLEGA